MPWRRPRGASSWRSSWTRCRHAAADPFWPPVHGEVRVPLPALGDFIELLRARGRRPIIERITGERRRLDSRDALEALRATTALDRPHGPERGPPPGRPARPGRPGRRGLDHPRSTADRHRDRSLDGPMTIEDVGPDGRPMIDPPDRAAWRAWLTGNHTRPDGIWVVMDRRGTNPRCVDYEVGRRRGALLRLDRLEGRQAGRRTNAAVVLAAAAARYLGSDEQGTCRTPDRGRPDDARRTGRHRGREARRDLDPAR